MKNISVCIATYNGESWIEEQLKSILSQLRENDEIVLVDDKSTDNTLEKVKNFGDSRIRIFCNESNLGVDETFQKALENARGELLFLSDQDDIWYPNKASRIIEIFNKQLDVTLILSDAQIIDSKGLEKGFTYFERRGRFIPGVIPNILKSKFLGCAIAVRSNMRKHFLPFPSPIPGHDMWIGLINEYYGKTYFIDEPLIYYRRHDKNTSPEKRQNFQQMLVWRWQLIKAFIKHIW